jgi:hypothetical protein
MTISDNALGAILTGGSCFTSHTNNIDVPAIGGLTFATPQ